MAITLLIEGKPYDVEVVSWRPNLVVVIDGRRHEVTDPDNGRDGHRSAVIDGALLRFARSADDNECHIRIGGRTVEVKRLDPRDAAGGKDHSQDIIKAPMPGVVIEVFRKAGDAVVRGDKVATIESMKLQTVLIAPRDGKIASLKVATGETFQKDAVIAELEPLAGKA